MHLFIYGFMYVHICVIVCVCVCVCVHVLMWVHALTAFKVINRLQTFIRKAVLSFIIDLTTQSWIY